MAVPTTPSPLRSSVAMSLQQLLDNELELVSPATRLSTYSALLKLLKRDHRNSTLAESACSKTLPFLVTDLEEKLTEEALSLLGTLLQVGNPGEKDLDKVVATISKGLQDTLDKTLCRKGLWCLANVKMTSALSVDTVYTLFETASFFLTKDAPVQSVGVLHEACSLLANLGNRADTLQNRILILFKLLLPCVFHENENIRKVSFNVLSGPFGDSRDFTLTDPGITEDLKSLYIPKLHDMSTRGVFDSLKLWEFVIKILGSLLLDPSMVATLNALLKIEEILLKSSNLKLRHQALKSWKLIINLLTSSEKHKSSKNKLKLMTVPLKTSENKHPSIAATKLDLWWLLMNRLGGAMITDRFEDTVLSFLSFCFGTEDSPSKGIAAASPSVSQEVVSALVCLLSPKEQESVNTFSRSEVLLTLEAFRKHQKELQLFGVRALKSLPLSECHLVNQLLEQLLARSLTTEEMSVLKKSVLRWWIDQIKDMADDSLVSGDDFTALYLTVCTEIDEEIWNNLENVLSENIEISKKLMQPLCVAVQKSPPSVQSRFAVLVARILPVILRKDLEHNIDEAVSTATKYLETFSPDLLVQLVGDMKKTIQNLQMRPADFNRFWGTLAEKLDLKKQSDLKKTAPELATGKTGRKKSDDDDFVVISTPPSKKTKRVLTEHQKEVLRSRRLLSSIPAMYNDYSQSNSQFIDSETNTQMEASTPPVAVDSHEDAQALLEMPSKSNATLERRCNSLSSLASDYNQRALAAKSSSLPPCCDKLPEDVDEIEAGRETENVQSCDIFAETSFDNGKTSESPKEAKATVSSSERSDMVTTSQVSQGPSGEPANDSIVTQDWLLTPQWNLSSVSPIYAPLINCEDQLEPLLSELAAPSWTRGIAEFLKSRGISTVGHLASLPELVVQQLPFKAPQCEKVRRVLDKFYARCNDRHQSSNGNKPQLRILRSSDDAVGENFYIELMNYQGTEAIVRCTSLDGSPDSQSAEQLTEFNIRLSPSTQWSGSIPRNNLSSPGLNTKWKFTALTATNDHLCEAVFPDGSVLVDSPDRSHIEVNKLRIVKFSPDRGICHGGEEVLIISDKIVQGDIKVRFFVNDVSGRELWSVLVDCQIHQGSVISFRTPSFRDQSIQEPVTVNFHLVSANDESSSNICDFRFAPAPLSTEGFASLPKETVLQAILDILSSRPDGKEILREVIYQNLK